MNNKNKQLLISSGIYILFLFLSIFSIYWVWLNGPTYFNGDDLLFHLSRIEGLANALGEGELLPRINYFLASGMGYPTGIFYPEIFLYPAAIFRAMGCSLVTSYQLYLILLNFITFVIAYRCFYLVNPVKWGAATFAILYGISSYRMSDVIYRAAIGECLAFMLFPLIYVGIYQIIYGDKHKWWLLALGMTGLIYCHALSAFLAVLFLIIYCLLSIRLIYKDRSRLKRLLLATGLTILLSADVYLPMIEQIMFQRLRVQDVSLFYLSKEAESLWKYLTIAYNNAGFNNIGLLIPVLLLCGVLSLKMKSKENRRLILIAAFFFLLATSFFPHKLFQETFFNAIQFPWRYFLIVTFLVCWVTIDSLITMEKLNYKIKFFISGLLVVVAIGLNFQNQQILVNYRQVGAQDFKQLDGQSLGYGKEFLPSDMKGWMTSTSLISEPKDKIITTNMARNGNAFYLHYKATEPTRLIYPILYYKGYVAEINGKEQPIEDAGNYESTSMHGFVQVTVEGEGSVLVWYKGTVIQKISRLISLGSLVVFIVYSIIKRRKIEKT